MDLGVTTLLSDLSRAARYPEPMHACHFCGSPTPSQWAVTARNRDAPSDRWRREIVPICPRCNRLLDKAGPEGCRLKTTGEWWYAGHTVGRHFDSSGANAMQEQAEREPKKDQPRLDTLPAQAHNRGGRRSPPALSLDFSRGQSEGAGYLGSLIP